MTRLLKIV